MKTDEMGDYYVCSWGECSKFLTALIFAVGPKEWNLLHRSIALQLNIVMCLLLGG